MADPTALRQPSQRPISRESALDFLNRTVQLARKLEDKLLSIPSSSPISHSLTRIEPTSKEDTATCKMADALDHLSSGRTRIEWLSSLNTEFKAKKNYRRTSIICTIGIHDLHPRLEKVLTESKAPRPTRLRKSTCCAKANLLRARLECNIAYVILQSD